MFLRKSIGLGIVLTVPEFLCYCSSLSDRNFGLEGNNPFKNSEAMGFNNPILKALNIGITAPNPHNVQPWKFEILDDQSANLYVDERRLLKDTDPPARQIHIGQGTFLETLAIGASQFGYKAEFTIFPNGKYTTSDIGKKPIAKISLEKSSNVSVDPLADYIPKRATNRSVYFGDPLSENDFSNLLIDAKLRFSQAFFVNEKESAELKKSTISAMGIETNTYNTYEESRIWFRYNDDEINSKRDGLSLRGSGLSGVKYFAVRNFFLKPGKDSWHSESNRKAGLDMFVEQVNSSKGFIYLKTSQNRILDWILVGRDYVRLQLAATKYGFVIHPLSQILQEYSEMDALRVRFENEMRLKKGEKIQMLVRIGKSDYEFFSPRRNLKNMIAG
ncbi:hypothetical protein LEP1GSC058_3845 [Leptospira fainei serovar Hurstbridge str. BUT 6]|uniref:Uncharacterized protein n=1 Tax=Leptospira fainei serovar Hurstbridge str. BUT 6 TaxID=1193011 RepID=S3UYC1_9LEPT|nr:hypothetical protein [Leptospira fainei]EPG73364.1 hypothetical protein LEP1GSC058_3845 [Leptospira fainei serovar Hurstbridge str. BUT 6]